MASRGTGFHWSDPDWTKGRAIAIAHVEALARREAALARNVTLVALLSPADLAAKIGGE